MGDIKTDVTPAQDLSAVSQLTPAEQEKLEATVADHIHSNGMHGYGTGAHLGGDAHRESVAQQIINARQPEGVTLDHLPYGDIYGGGSLLTLHRNNGPQ